MAGDADKVAPLDKLVKEVERFVAEVGFADIELDLPGLVAEVGKDGLAVVADKVDPACGGHALRALLVGDL